MSALTYNLFNRQAACGLWCSHGIWGGIFWEIWLIRGDVLCSRENYTRCGEKCLDPHARLQVSACNGNMFHPG